jgi:hypothetical protein
MREKFWILPVHRWAVWWHTMSCCRTHRWAVWSQTMSRCRTIYFFLGHLSHSPWCTTFVHSHCSFITICGSTMRSVVNKILCNGTFLLIDFHWCQVRVALYQEELHWGLAYFKLLLHLLVNDKTAHHKCTAVPYSWQVTAKHWHNWLYEEQIIKCH